MMRCHPLHSPSVFRDADLNKVDRISWQLRGNSSTLVYQQWSKQCRLSSELMQVPPPFCSQHTICQAIDFWRCQRHSAGKQIRCFQRCCPVGCDLMCTLRYSSLHFTNAHLDWDPRSWQSGSISQDPIMLTGPFLDGLSLKVGAGTQMCKPSVIIFR